MRNPQRRLAAAVCAALTGFKRVKGRKRHILVDTLGLLLSVRVFPADQADQQAGAEVQSRMTVYEILQTELLNSIKAKHPTSRIEALDFNRGIAVVQLANGGMQTVSFDTTTLAIKS